MPTKYKVTETNGDTGVTIERDATPEEIAQMEIDAAARVIELEKTQAKLAAKESAIAKLAELGLTEDEAKAIVG